MKQRKVRFLFYRARFEWRNIFKKKIRLVDDGISWWTWPGNIGTGPYSHVEVWLPDEDGRFGVTYEDLEWEVPRKAYIGTAFTSTMRGENNGTVKRPASKVLKHPERWDYKEFEIDENLYLQGKYWMNKKVRDNKGYSFRDIGKFFGLGFLADESRDICSEFGHNYGVIIMLLKPPFNVVSPRRLSRMLPGEMRRLK